MPQDSDFPDMPIYDKPVYALYAHTKCLVFPDSATLLLSTKIMLSDRGSSDI